MTTTEKSSAVLLAAMRAEVIGEDGVFYTMDGRKVLEYLDRIEAAAKREFKAIMPKCAAGLRGIPDCNGCLADCVVLRRKLREQVSINDGHDGQPVVVNDIPTDNSTKTQKDRVLSFGADGAAPAGHGQGNWEHVGKLPWTVDYCWDIRDANGYVIAKVNENLSEEAYKRMCEFIAAAANATAGPCNAAKLRMALEKMATWANEEGCEYCVGDREQMAKQALEELPRNCDVGTADEQMRMFKMSCDAHPTCAGCPCGSHPAPSCGIAWAQLPYEAAQEGGDHADA